MNVRYNPCCRACAEKAHRCRRDWLDDKARDHGRTGTSILIAAMLESFGMGIFSNGLRDVTGRYLHHGQ